MSGNWDEVSRDTTDARRRKQMLEKRRRRQRKVKRMKRVLLMAAVLVLFVSAVLVGTGFDGDSPSGSILDVKETLQVAVDAGAGFTTKEPEKAAVIYPEKSLVYSDIADEAVKSPCIALLDVENAQVIAGRDYDSRIYPASMTKVMTLIVAAENLTDLDRQYVFTEDLIYPLVQQEASRAGFDPGEPVSVNDLFYGLVLPSGADAAVALANLTAGSEEAFAERMNRKCEELGLVNTHFINASGLYDDEQYTTPVEMAMIMAYAMKNPVCAKVLSTYQYTTEPTEQHPEGILLTSTMFSRMYGTEVEGVTILAGKTGYTDEAGNCLVSYAEKDGHHYVAVTAAASYKWHPIFDDFEIYKNYLPS